MPYEQALQIALAIMGKKVVGEQRLTNYSISVEKSGNILFIDIKEV